jgi:nitrogen fixation NifU-like protein
VRYSPTLVDHFLHPRNAGLLRDADGIGEDQFDGCGDLARFFLRFQTYGCGPTIAAASVASELLQGRTVEELVEVKAETIEQALGGLPEDRKHAAEVAAGAVRAAALDCLRRRTPGV